MAAFHFRSISRDLSDISIVLVEHVQVISVEVYANGLILGVLQPFNQILHKSVGW